MAVLSYSIEWFPKDYLFSRGYKQGMVLRKSHGKIMASKLLRSVRSKDIKKNHNYSRNITLTTTHAGLVSR